MHHHNPRGDLLRLSVWLTATALVLFCLHGPGAPEPEQHTVAVRDHPRAAAVPVPSQSVAPQSQPPPTAYPPPRPQPRGTVDGKNLKGAAAVPKPAPRRAVKPAGKPVPKAARKAAPKAGARKGARKGDSASRSRARAPKKPRYRVPGQDISWPQCPPNVGIRDLKGLSQPMPYEDIRFLIIGLTNGRSFTRNPCLKMHLDWARRHHVWTAAYAFTTFPHDWQVRRLGDTGPYNGRRWLGRVQNTAWKTAIFNIRTMREHDFRSPHIWIDVEASSSRPWTGNKQWNRAVLDAWIKAYRDSGHTVGIYSSRYIWQGIMGQHRMGLPEWRTAGPASPRAALARCRERSFQGGHGILAQWWDNRRDYDRMCPGFQGQATMRRFFVKF